MKGNLKKSLSIVLVLAMLFSLSVISTAADSGIDYQITNPYETVNWSTWGAYKGNLHCHTLVSDGGTDFADMIEHHYEIGYDFLSLTDHGTISYSWTDVNTVPAIALLGKNKAKDINYIPTPLSQERFTEITTSGTDGKTMIQVPNGIELNPTSLNNAHVNAWFGNYGNGIIGGTSDYETAIKGVQEDGGLCVINHPGEYTKAKEEDNPDLAYNEDYQYYIDKFTNLLLKYDACIGIDVNSKGDGRTRNDRKLWDILLQNCVPNGRNVFGIATSDAHSIEACDTGWTIHMLPELTSDAIRTSLEDGTFFAGSRCLKNSKELAQISAATGLELGTEWRADSTAVQPKVTNISVNQSNDTITIDADNALVIRWIADGELIAEGNTIDLDDYSDKIGSYIRAEIFGEGGILYTQAFTLDYDDVPGGANVDGFFDYGNLVATIRNTLLKILAKFPGFDSIWQALTGNTDQIN